MSPDRIKTILADTLGVDDGRVTDIADIVEDLGADSLDVVELVLSFEEDFGIEIPDADIERLRTVADVRRYIETHT